MAIIGRWTSPTLIFKMPFDARAASKLSIAFKQANYPTEERDLLFEKTLMDCVINETEIRVELGEEETARLCADRLTPIYMQIRLVRGGKSLESRFIQADPYLVLKDGAL